MSLKKSSIIKKDTGRILTGKCVHKWEKTSWEVEEVNKSEWAGWMDHYKCKKCGKTKITIELRVIF